MLSYHSGGPAAAGAFGREARGELGAPGALEGGGGGPRAAGRAEKNRHL